MADRSDKLGLGGISCLALGFMSVVSGVQILFIIGMILFLSGILLMIRWWFSAS